MSLDTFQGLYTDVLDHGFGSTRYLLYAKDKVNEAQLEIAKRLDVEELNTQQTFNTSAGTGISGLQSNFLKIKYVYETTDDSNQSVLEPLPDGITLESLDRLKRGKPTHWFVQGQTLYMYPIPDKVYAMIVRYYKKPTVMSGDADVPDLPSELRPLIVSYAVALCYRREQDFAAYQTFMGDFDRGILQAAAVQGRMEGEQAIQVPGMW